VDKSFMFQLIETVFWGQLFDW